MNNSAKHSRKIPVKLTATIPQDQVTVEAEVRAIPLPAGPHGKDGEIALRYGPYLEAVHHLLLKDDYQKLLQALGSRLSRVVSVEEIDCLEIRSEKHGAFYHVARVDVWVSGQKVSFAVNVAAIPEARNQLARDFRLLENLNKRYNYQFLPNVYFKGAGSYREKGKPAKWLHMFVAEWFSNFHEFHLHRDEVRGSTRVLLWDPDRASVYLSEHQCQELYRQAARILTLYYDYNNFKQIFPWHHAAGDFVLKEDQGKVDVRLITIRDYGAVVDFTSRKKAAKLLGLILFFLHLTIQMRIDRLDGVGQVVWAEDHCLQGTIAGFFAGLEQGEGGSRKNIPQAKEIRKLFCRFSRDEWLQLLVKMFSNYKFSQEELTLLSHHGDTHIDLLIDLLVSSE
ncbi:MAG: hypothetical protein LJE89_05525 [Deltaproteobacteria bacterium]|nr:hypothetical protein [Deltaproteobacteria bacterium]